MRLESYFYAPLQDPNSVAEPAEFLAIVEDKSHRPAGGGSRSDRSALASRIADAVLNGWREAGYVGCESRIDERLSPLTAEQVRQLSFEAGVAMTPIAINACGIARRWVYACVVHRGLDQLRCLPLSVAAFEADALRLGLPFRADRCDWTAPNDAIPDSETARKETPFRV